MARTVWQHFSLIRHKPSDMNSIYQLISTWMHGLSRRSQLGYGDTWYYFRWLLVYMEREMQIEI